MKKLIYFLFFITAGIVFASSGGFLPSGLPGVQAINGNSSAFQTITSGTSGSNVSVSSSTGTTTINIPDAAAGARGVVTTGAQTFAGVKTFSSAPICSALTATTVPYLNGSKQLTSSTVTPTELSYLSGVTSAIQDQIDSKADLASPTFTGTVTTPNLVVSGLTATTVPYLNGSKQLTSSAVTPTELGYVSGVSSALQTQINAKAPSASPTFTGTTTFSSLTATTVPYLDGSKVLTSSAVTPTELGYVSGVTSAIQTQISAKASSATPTFTGAATMGSASGADLIWSTSGGGNIGVATGQASGTDRRPNNIFTKGTVIAGNVLNNTPPYGLNNGALAGIIGAGNNTANVSAVIGASSVFNSVAQGFLGYAKDGGFANVPGFVNLNTSSTDLDVYFSVMHLGSARNDYLKFGSDGTLTMMKSSGANLLWNTDGAGNIGAAGTSRPDNLYLKSAANVGTTLTMGASSGANMLWTTDSGGTVGKLLPAATAEVTQVVTVADVANSLRGTCWLISSTTDDYYVWYRTSGFGVDPSCASTGVLVDVPTGSTAAAVATATKTALDAIGGTPFSTGISTATLTVTNTTAGLVTGASDTDTGFAITTVTEGFPEFWGVNRPDALYAKTLIRLGNNELFDYGPEGWAPSPAIEMSQPGSDLSGNMSASANQFRIGVYAPNATPSQNNFLYWDINQPGIIQIRNTEATLTTSWLALDGSSTAGTDKQSIDFYDKGRLIWATDGGTGDAGAIGSVDHGSTMNRPAEVWVKGLIDVNQTVRISSDGTVKSGNYHTEASEVNDGNSGTADTIDWGTGSAHLSTLTGSVTYTFSNPQAGGNYTLRIATGAGGFTVTWPAAVKWASGVAPTITVTASKVDIIKFYYDGTSYYGQVFGQNY
jgi:hypothetical protein